MAITMLVAMVAAGCGRAGPGATLARRKDPDVEAHDVEHRKCVALVQRKRLIVVNRHFARTEDFHCDEWETTSVEHVAAVRPEAHTRQHGPAPLFSAIPAGAIGRTVTEAGGSTQSSHWIDAGVQVHFIPPPDRISAYASAGYLTLGNQGDLSGFYVGGGAMLALTSSVSLDAHGGIVTRDSSPWRAGGGIRWRPRHHTSRDWTVGLSLEHVSGADRNSDNYPYALYENHATGIVFAIAGGWLP